MNNRTTRQKDSIYVPAYHPPPTTHPGQGRVHGLGDIYRNPATGPRWPSCMLPKSQFLHPFAILFPLIPSMHFSRNFPIIVHTFSIRLFSIHFPQLFINIPSFPFLVHFPAIFHEFPIQFPYNSHQICIQLTLLFFPLFPFRSIHPFSMNCPFVLPTCSINFPSIDSYMSLHFPTCPFAGVGNIPAFLASSASMSAKDAGDAGDAGDVVHYGHPPNGRLMVGGRGRRPLHRKISLRVTWPLGCRT